MDNDGDLDIVITNCNGKARVLRNEPAPKGHWLGIRVVDPTGRDALGAVVDVQAGGVTQRRSVRCAESYLSSRDPRVHFGLGSSVAVEEVRVTWPDGTRETFSVPEVDRYYQFSKSEGIRASED